MRVSMTEVFDFGEMLNEADEDSPSKCRERRRRRIDMRRLASVSSSGGSPAPEEPPSLQENCTEGSYSVAEGKRIRTGENNDPLSTSASPGDDLEVMLEAPNLPTVINVAPVFGTMSVAGMSRDMEDTICVRMNLCRPEINERRPVHFFGVYDGHGGPHVSDLCRERMHRLMEEELMRVGSVAGGESCGSSGGSSSSREEHQKQGKGLEEAEHEAWRRAIRRCFERMDEVALITCACGSMGYQCGCHPMEVAIAGSTAAVVLLTPKYIVVANCGDSRAVLCRAGRAVPLSFDHKPDRQDELARIEALGGRVIFVNGARVEGILAMSRAIGDRYLKPFVTAEPEMSFTERGPEDDCLILASDGLWDVLSSDLACEVASECLREGSPNVRPLPQMEEEQGGALYPSRSASAAALLTRLALGRRSCDNISVIVVDLKRS